MTYEGIKTTDQQVCPMITDQDVGHGILSLEQQDTITGFDLVTKLRKQLYECKYQCQCQSHNLSLLK